MDWVVVLVMMIALVILLTLAVVLTAVYIRMTAKKPAPPIMADERRQYNGVFQDNPLEKRLSLLIEEFVRRGIVSERKREKVGRDLRCYLE